ncbi:PH-like domain-containing protein [Gulosibacter molinativorax]|uniref:PH domain-containing protein n=1 Tax=Gulosibacter molinativorax TaxID=256821 RepID=A0ABT7C783_9MICO|nr:hypothetical protein [Gulosibacter molinativorax]MDJ1371066.1 hypothetical protein [Gulosibacter molinativorax]QUY61426.1 Hypothetical protein GMOLON4_713 [Gulosibacter molinativorax]
MGPFLFTVAILLVFAILIGAMWLGWNRRRRRQAYIPVAPELPAGLGQPTLAVEDAHYVATSVTGDALDRIAVRPLAYRGRAEVEVHPEGVAIAITGERAFFIPTDSITLVALGQATIDRAVEPNGLTVIQWNLGEGENTTSVETYLRVPSPAVRRELLDALSQISELSNATREEHK